MDTEKQRQHRRDNARLTESGNARSEQLLLMPTEQLTNWNWVPGEPLNGPAVFWIWNINIRLVSCMNWLEDKGWLFQYVPYLELGEFREVMPKKTHQKWSAFASKVPDHDQVSTSQKWVTLHLWLTSHNTDSCKLTLWLNRFCTRSQHSTTRVVKIQQA